MDTRGPAQPGRVEFLDSLRGIASVWVVMEHVALMPNPRLQTPGWLDLYVVNGNMGVELFFVVSAYSLCLSMKTHKMEQRPLLGFWIRRFFRIAPLFYLLVATTFIYNPAGFPLTFWSLLTNISLLFNIFPYYGFSTSVVLGGWVIGVEMIFYALFPFLYKRIHDFYLAVLYLLAALTIERVLSLFIDAMSTDPNNFKAYSFLHKGPVFMFGLVAFFLVKALDNNEHKRRIGALLIATAPLQFFALKNNAAPFIDAYFWEGILFGSVVVGFALAPPSFFVNRITAWFGTISYSVYLVHSPIVALLFPFFAKLQRSGMNILSSYLISYFTTMLIVVPVALLTYFLVERPFNRLGRRVSRRVAGRIPTTPSKDVTRQYVGV